MIRTMNIFVSWLTVELLIANCYRCRMSLFGKTLCGNQFPFLDLFSGLGQLALETHTVKVLSFFATRQRSCGKLMFSVVSVCSQGRSHVTITHDALDITIHGLPPLSCDCSPSPSQASSRQRSSLCRDPLSPSPI